MILVGVVELRTHFEDEPVDPTNLGPWSRVMSSRSSTSSQADPICSNVISMRTDKKTRDALRKVREAIERAHQDYWSVMSSRDDGR